MNAKTLIEMLENGMEYGSSWAIYAKRIDGEFKPESPARCGQRVFENGGLGDECQLFADNETAANRMLSFLGENWASESEDMDPSIVSQCEHDAALMLIDYINEMWAADTRDDARALS